MTHSSTLDIPISETKRTWQALIALFLVPITGISVDIYTPSLPAINHYFHANQAWAQFSITIYILGLGIMQLFAGAISDSFGRKKPFLIAMLLFMAATLAIPTVAQDIYQLVFFRGIQGVAVGMIIVSMRAVIPDLFTGKELFKMTSYMTIAWSIGPIIAPAIGGYLQQHWGWQANFYFLLAYSIMGFVFVLFFLPETSSYRHPFNGRLILERYRTILFNREFLRDLTSNGLLYSIMLMFSIVGSFYIQTILHYSALQFGHIALLLGLAWFLGSMSARFMLNIAFNTKVQAALWSLLAVTSLMLILLIAHPLSIYSFVIPLLVIFGLGGMLLPNYFAHALSLYPKIAGSANALFGSALFLISGAIAALGSLLKTSTPLPLTIAYLTLILLCLGIFYSVTQSEGE